MFCIIEISDEEATFKLSETCKKCLNETDINHYEGPLFDCDGDGIIGCHDVINQRLFGCNSTCPVEEYGRVKSFEECMIRNDNYFIQTQHDHIHGDIQSLVVVNDHIFALTPSYVYKFDKSSLALEQSTLHSLGENAFFYVSPNVYEPEEQVRDHIRVCLRSKVTLECINFQGMKGSSIDFNMRFEEKSFKNQLKFLEASMPEDSKREEYNQELKLLNFFVNQEKNSLMKNAIEPLFPYSYLMIGSGSDFPRTLNLIHAFYEYPVVINCSAFNGSQNYEQFTTLNHNFNPSTKTLSFFLHNQHGVLVASAHISEIVMPFESKSTTNLEEKLCNLKPIPGMGDAVNGIRLENTTFLLSNVHNKPIMITEGQDPLEVYWNPTVHALELSDKIKFVASTIDGSEVYGYSSNRILKLKTKIDNRMTTAETHFNFAWAVSSPVISILVLLAAAAIWLIKIRKPSQIANDCPSIELPDVVAPRRAGRSVLPSFCESNLIEVQDLKQGYFGDVKRGKLVKDSKNIEVAIKSLKQPDPDSLKREANMIVSLDHPNILELIGIVVDRTTKQPVSLLFPFIENGDLLEYLKSKKKSHDRPNLKQLLGYSIDVASGMKYLTSLGIVHRDLAARNCFLDKNMVVKVGDFGLSRMLDRESLAHELNSNSLIPANHPPDVVETGFNEATDVWSFGLLLFEVFTFGTCPPVDLNLLPSQIAQVVSACQSRDQKDRPTFYAVKNLLRNIDGDTLTERQRATRNGYVSLA